MATVWLAGCCHMSPVTGVADSPPARHQCTVLMHSLSTSNSAQLFTPSAISPGEQADTSSAPHLTLPASAMHTSMPCVVRMTGGQQNGGWSLTPTLTPQLVDGLWRSVAAKEASNKCHQAWARWEEVRQAQERVRLGKGLAVEEGWVGQTQRG